MSRVRAVRFRQQVIFLFRVNHDTISYGLGLDYMRNFDAHPHSSCTPGLNYSRATDARLVYDENKGGCCCFARKGYDHSENNETNYFSGF